MHEACRTNRFDLRPTRALTFRRGSVLFDLSSLSAEIFPDTGFSNAVSELFSLGGFTWR